MASELATLLADLKEKEALEMVKRRLNAGDDPMKILEESR